MYYKLFSSRDISTVIEIKWYNTASECFDNNLSFQPFSLSDDITITRNGKNKQFTIKGFGNFVLRSDGLICKTTKQEDGKKRYSYTNMDITLEKQIKEYLNNR